MSIMNTQQIMDILPHRSPFLLIDTVEELQPGVKCVAKKNVTMNEPHFMGHFPGNPVMPGVLIIEALAQTGAVAILCQDEWKGKTAYFAGINNAKFKQKTAYEIHHRDWSSDVCSSDLDGRRRPSGFYILHRQSALPQPRALPRRSPQMQYTAHG